MNYHRTTWLLLGLVASIVVVAIVPWGGGPAETDPFALLPERIREHQADLLHVAKLAREGGGYREAYEAVRAKWPELTGPLSVDANGNVYFVVSSNVFANAGFICRQGDAAFLGDGFEPRIRETKHLFGSWWYYRSS